MKDNSHKKDYWIDKFARKYYCQRARLNQLRCDKEQARKKTRCKNRREERDIATDNSEINS